MTPLESLFCRLTFRPAPALIVALALCCGACSSTANLGGRQLPRFEPPLKPDSVQRVRTTAYTHSEADHRKYGRRTALGTTLRYGRIKSAAADWSRWPAGTRFRIRETGDICEVDDYGWMLAGTNTIDLYKPSQRAMNRWGVRHVTIEILHWGDPRRSHAVLAPRRKHAHVALMVEQLERRHRL